MRAENKFRPGSSVYFIGIKGTGMCALAELMHGAGMKVSGCDTGEVFYTDAILKELNIPYYESFNAAHITGGFDMVVYSAAYSARTNPELAEALRRNLPAVKYPDALGAWSARFDSAGIAGVHGKTTTTAISGVLARAAGIPAQILAGSAAADFNGRSTLMLGSRYFIAETCEYRKHFLAFHPKRIILTAVESDHQDFFPDYKSIRGAFIEYCRLLPAGGQLIFCADDPGAREVAAVIGKEARGVEIIPYGFGASGGYKVSDYRVENERAVFRVACFPHEFTIKIPGRHQALNCAAALALTSALVKKEFAAREEAQGSGWTQERLQAVQKALEGFKGCKRRCETIGEAGGIIFMDDYGHHPTAIKTTLAGLKSFYPARRIVASFMSHTYTRTAALLDDFAAAFAGADVLLLHKIYASARETYQGGVTGKTLCEKIAENRGAEKRETVRYIDEPLDAFGPLKEILRPGDIFITIGAGNNWPLCEKLFRYFNSLNRAGESHD
jgi:UDP-N-acetylmuramate--alanine ligase